MSGARKAKLFARALASNAVNAVSKDLHAWIRRSTGRGGEAASPEAIAAYATTCFHDHLDHLGVARGGETEFLRGRLVLEHGPGDVPGVALLMVAHGARGAVLVDRFPLLRFSDVNRQALRLLADGLAGPERERFLACFGGGRIESGLAPERIRHVVSADGLSGLSAEAGLSCSRSVLEHVNRLDATLADIARALEPGAPLVHCVDLRGHDFEWKHPLDFLTVSERAWRLMSSHNGSMPNRLRVSDHRRVLATLPFEDVRLEPTVLIEPAVAEAARGRLAAPFRGRSLEDLTTLGFWLTARRATGR